MQWRFVAARHITTEAARLRHIDCRGFPMVNIGAVEAGQKPLRVLVSESEASENHGRNDDFCCFPAGPNYNALSRAEWPFFLVRTSPIDLPKLLEETFHEHSSY